MIFHGNNGYANAPQGSNYMYVARLVCIFTFSSFSIILAV